MGQANARDSQTPERSAENAEALRLLQIEIDRLAPDDRSAVVLCCQEGLSLTDAAGVLGQPRETVRDRVLRTLKGLRERLGRLGVTLSSMALVGLLQEGGHLPEPSSLCKWLDAQWQASSCGQVAPAKVQAQPPAQILSGLNAPRSILPAATVTVTGALLFVLCLAFLNPPPGNAVTAPSPEAEPLYAERANASAIPQEEEKEMKKSLMAASILAAMSMTQAGAGDGDAKLPGPTTGPAQRTESKQETVKAAVSASLKKEAPKAATNSGQQVPAIKELQGERE